MPSLSVQRYPLQLGFQSNPARYSQGGAARLINGFVENTGQEGKSERPIWVRPGLRSFIDLEWKEGVRQLYATEHAFYAVAGERVFECNQYGRKIPLGNVPNGASVSFARNRTNPAQVVMVTGGGAYVIQNSAMRELAEVSALGPIDVTFVSGYFVFALPDGRFYWTDVDDVTLAGALAFGNAEANPDGLQRCITRGLELWLVGSKTIEVWGLTGEVDTAFSRVGGGFAEWGCLDGRTLVQLQSIVVMCAHDGTVRAFRGYDGERVSNHEVERDIQRVIATGGDMMAWAIETEGHNFYVLVGPDFTWVWDLVTGLWYQWESFEKKRWRAVGAADFANMIITGDVDKGKLYILDFATPDEAGERIIMRHVTPIQNGFPDKAAWYRLHLDVMTGKGAGSIALRWSDDGGSKWSAPMVRSLGALGETQREVMFTGLGTSSRQGRMFEIIMDGNGARGFLGAAADVAKRTV